MNSEESMERISESWMEQLKIKDYWEKSIVLQEET